MSIGRILHIKRQKGKKALERFYTEYILRNYIIGKWQQKVFVSRRVAWFDLYFELLPIFMGDKGIFPIFICWEKRNFTHLCCASFFKKAVNYFQEKTFNYLTSPLSAFLAAHIYYKFSLATLKVSVNLKLHTPAFYFSIIYFLNFLFHVHYTINTCSMNCHWLTDHGIICERNKYFIIYFEICFISTNTIIFKLPGTMQLSILSTWIQKSESNYEISHKSGCVRFDFEVVFQIDQKFCPLWTHPHSLSGNWPHPHL